MSNRGVGGKLIDCCVIIPVGPGHERAAKDAVTSVMKAAETPGPFKNIFICLGDDTKGDKGRSHTRNAIAYGDKAESWMTFLTPNNGPDNALFAEWLFFLDADDLMYPEAFHLVRKKVKDHDAIWGTIVELRGGQLIRRGGQPDILRSYKQLINVHEDPAENAARTLQIGHFVRRDRFVGFDEDLDAGEDWRYILEMWHEHRCCRIGRPLMINRRGISSEGPRSAHGGHWREAVGKLVTEAREDMEKRRKIS